MQSTDNSATFAGGATSQTGADTNPATKVSESLEKTLGQEPNSSIIRTALLAAAGASILASLAFKALNKADEALFVGQWPPTLIAIALWYQVTKAQYSAR